jgi:hypothetical protein
MFSCAVFAKGWTCLPMSLLSQSLVDLLASSDALLSASLVLAAASRMPSETLLNACLSASAMSSRIARWPSVSM